MRKPVDGFTLIELMIIVALLAIVVTIAIPNFTSLVRDNRVQSQAEELNSLMQYARSEAVIRKIPVSVALNSNSGEIGVTARGEVIRATTLQLSGVDFDVSANQIDYRSNGTASVLDFQAVFCRNNDASTGYLLTVTGSGSTSLHPKGKTANGTSLGSCSL